MPPRLTHEVSSAESIAPLPTGIYHHLEENDIETTVSEQGTFKDIHDHEILDREGKPIREVDSDENVVMTERPMTPEERWTAAYNAGKNIIEIYSQKTDFSQKVGELSYSELKTERTLDELAKNITQQDIEQEGRIIAAHTSSTDPDKKKAALTQLENGIDPEVAPQYFKNQEIITRLGAKGKAATPAEKGNLKRLKQAQRDIIRKHSDAATFKRTRAYSRRRRDRAVRGGIKGSEEDAAMNLSGKGQHRGIKHYKGIVRRTSPETGEKQFRDIRELKKREKAEESQLANIIARKGTIIQKGNRKYIVKDVETTPAQAHRIIGFQSEDGPAWKAGDPIYDTDSAGRPKLHALYLPKLHNGKPVVNERTGKIEVIPTPIPRDTPYRSGPNKVTGLASSTTFYYADGTVALEETWGPDSFSPIDDKVILKPLLTGAEAIEVIVNGSTDRIEGLEHGLADIHYTLKALMEEIENGGQEVIVKDDLRRQILKEHLVFEASNDSTNDNLRPIHDRRPTHFRTSSTEPAKLAPHGTGHFRRFEYDEANSQTARQERALSFLQDVAARRMTEASKKGRKARQEMLLS